MLIGVDLGTTFTAVAAIGSEGKAEIITNRDGDRTTPSVVMFEEGTVIIGEQAKENSVIAPYNVCQFVKRQMGKKSFSFDVSKTEKYSAEEISALILKRMKEDAENAKDEKVDGVVITVPAYFDDAQRKATQDAGKIAGMDVLGIINEPTAAAIAYCYGQANSDGIMMVYDLGGGTFDITILKLSENLSKVEILATTGNRNLGGFDFDNFIITKVIEEFKRSYGVDIEDDDMAFQDLRIKAENAKKALSFRNKASISIIADGKGMKVDVTREEFEEGIKSYIESTIVSMERAMKDAKLKYKDLSKILLVGGSTRIPAIQNRIREVSGIIPSHELNPDEAVAIGAVYYAEILTRIKNGDRSVNKLVEVTDVNSHSLGVVSVDESTKVEVATFIIPRNTPLPARGERGFLTKEDNQETIYLCVVEGEDEDPDNDTIIGTSTLRLTPRPAGSPISVSMEYDTNGIIHVRVKDLVDGKDLGEMKIDREGNLTEDEVAKKKGVIRNANIE